MNFNVVWTAVASACSSFFCLMAAINHATDFVLAFGLIAISTALLAMRDA